MEEKKTILVTRSSMPDYEKYIEAIKPLWDSHWLTNMGKYHVKLEEELKKYLDVPNTSLMVNGHMALEMVIQAMNFPENSEVITTPFTFISTTHAIVRNGLTPVFCDIKKEDYTIDETKIEKLITEKTVAIVAVHVYGNICNVREIQTIADNHGLKVIYDAAHAFGECYDGEGVAKFGDASVFSFHATKVFNTIEGGAACFSDDELYTTLYNLKNFGIRNEVLIETVGANAKMNEFSAIMGLCNLELVELYIAQRKECAEWYNSLLGQCKQVKLAMLPNERLKRNYGYYPVEFQTEQVRDAVYSALRENGIYSRKYFYPITADAECYQGKYQMTDVSVARSVSKKILVLPLYPELEYADVKRICDIVLKTIQEL